MTNWVAYYRLPNEAIQIYRSENTKWEDLPEKGVQVILINYNSKYRDLMYGRDYYYSEPFRQTESFEPGAKCGITLTDDEFNECLEQAYV